MVKQSFPRRGAWCLLDGAIGIVAAFPYVERTTREQPDPEDAEKTIRVPVVVQHDDKAEVHLVDEKTGETKTVEHAVPVDALTMATFQQIPEKRRPEPKAAAALGYDVPAELLEAEDK